MQKFFLASWRLCERNTDVYGETLLRNLGFLTDVSDHPVPTLFSLHCVVRGKGVARQDDGQGIPPPSIGDLRCPAKRANPPVFFLTDAGALRAIGTTSVSRVVSSGKMQAYWRSSWLMVHS